MAVDLIKGGKQQISKELLINIAIILMSILLTTVLWLIFVSPKIATTKNLTKKIKSVSNLGKQKSLQLTKEKTHLFTEKNKINQKIKMFRDELRENKNIPAILNKFALIAKKRKLEFTHIQPLPKKSTTFKEENINMSIKETPISLNLEAGFVDFLSFLWDVEHSNQIFRIKKLSIEKNPKNPIRHKEKMVLNIYQLVEEDNNENN